MRKKELQAHLLHHVRYNHEVIHPWTAQAKIFLDPVDCDKLIQQNRERHTVGIVTRKVLHLYNVEHERNSN